MSTWPLKSMSILEREQLRWLRMHQIQPLQLRIRTWPQTGRTVNDVIFSTFCRVSRCWFLKSPVWLGQNLTFPDVYLVQLIQNTQFYGSQISISTIKCCKVVVFLFDVTSYIGILVVFWYWLKTITWKKFSNINKQNIGGFVKLGVWWAEWDSITRFFIWLLLLWQHLPKTTQLTVLPVAASWMTMRLSPAVAPASAVVTPLTMCWPLKVLLVQPPQVLHSLCSCLKMRWSHV